MDNNESQWEQQQTADQKRCKKTPLSNGRNNKTPNLVYGSDRKFGPSLCLSILATKIIMFTQQLKANKTKFIGQPNRKKKGKRFSRERKRKGTQLWLGETRKAGKHFHRKIMNALYIIPLRAV